MGKKWFVRTIIPGLLAGDGPQLEIYRKGILLSVSNWRGGQCGENFNSEMIYPSYRPKFCSVSCASKHQATTSSQADRLHTPEVQAKVSQTLKRIGHTFKERGGNGRPMPAPQQL